MRLKIIRRCVLAGQREDSAPLAKPIDEVILECEQEENPSQKIALHGQVDDVVQCGFGHGYAPYVDGRQVQQGEYSEI